MKSLLLAGVAIARLYSLGLSDVGAINLKKDGRKGRVTEVAGIENFFGDHRQLKQRHLSIGSLGLGTYTSIPKIVCV